MSLTEEVWRRDFGNVCDALRWGDWIVTGYDGLYVSLDAPQDMADLYSKLLTVGYAKGWIK